MRIKLAGNKGDSVILICQNAEATSTIPKGAPVVLKTTETAAAGDGLSVVLPATAGVASNALVYGVATAAIAPGQYGEAIAYGYASYAMVTVLTRSASSAVWPSTASLASGAILAIDTAYNAFSISAASIAQSAFCPFAVMLDSLASATTVSSATSGTGSSAVASQAAHRVFVRIL